MKGSTKKCQGCNKKFIQTGQRQTYCTKKCRNKYYLKTTSGIDTVKRVREDHKSVFKIIKKECLKCCKIFFSEHKFNRICLPCKHGVEFDKGSADNAYYA